MKNLKKIFNPNKITISGKSTILDTDNGKYVVKEKNKDLESLFNYLNSRSFGNYPKIIDKFDNNYVYEYIDDIKMPINQKAIDMAILLSSLHYKTSHYIKIVQDDIKEIYENIISNIYYFENYYNNIYDMVISEEYMRPSYYLLIRNQSKINELIKYLKDSIEKWYKDTITKDKIRVVYCHNNLSIDHFKEGEKNYFISWDNYTIDTPVLDLYNLYLNDFNKYDYISFLSKYLSEFNLLVDEKRLLFIMISLPKVINFNDNDMDNTIKVGKFIDYINQTEKVIKSFYPLDDSNK